MIVLKTKIIIASHFQNFESYFLQIRNEKLSSSKRDGNRSRLALNLRVLLVFKTYGPWSNVIAAVIPVVADVDVAGIGKKQRPRRSGGRKKTEGEPGRHNYKLHRYTQITRLLCASQPPDDHAVHVSSVVAREKREKEQETLSEWR